MNRRRPALTRPPKSDITEAPVAPAGEPFGSEAVITPFDISPPPAALEPSPRRDRTDPTTAHPLTLRMIPGELWHAFFRTGVTGLATQFAYSLFFATFPLLVLTMSLAALVERLFDVPVAATLRDLIDRSAPIVLQELLRELVDRAIAKASTGVASAGAVVATLLAVWGASGASGALVSACTRAYGVRSTRSFFVRRAVSVLLAMIFVVMTVVAGVLFIFGEAISRRFTSWVGGAEIHTIAVLLRWGLVVACTAVALLTLYRIGPELHLKVLWLLPGTAIATGLWLLVLLGFSALLKVTNPGDPYGLFSSLVVLLWFFYLTGVTFMLGAVVNAVIGLPYDELRRADLAHNPEKRLYCEDGHEVG
jgi:membrane protein